MAKSRLKRIAKPIAAQSRNTSEHDRGIRFDWGCGGPVTVVSFAVITPPRCRSDPAIVVDWNRDCPQLLREARREQQVGLGGEGPLAGRRAAIPFAGVP